MSLLTLLLMLLMGQTSVDPDEDGPTVRSDLRSLTKRPHKHFSRCFVVIVALSYFNGIRYKKCDRIRLNNCTFLWEHADLTYLNELVSK